MWHTYIHTGKFRYDFLMILVDVLLFKNLDPFFFRIRIWMTEKVPDPLDLNPEKNRIRNLTEQNIDQNHQNIEPKFSEKRPFLLKKCNMTILYSYIIWSLSKNLLLTLKGIRITKTKSEIFRFWVRFKQDPVQNCLHFFSNNL